MATQPQAFRLKRLTRKYAEAGSYRQALDLAHGQTNPLVKANALAGIAEGLMDVNGTPIILGLGYPIRLYDKGLLTQF